MSESLTDFLLARIAEDERHWGNPAFAPELVLKVRVECEAKRRIVKDFQHLDADYRATHSEFTEARRFQALVAVGHLATAYADHDDYREEWKP